MGFTKITPEQSMYMWRFLTCVFFFQCILVFVYAGLLHLGNFWAVTIPWGIVVWYTAIQHIYVDHDVMHGATFPPYWWQKFLTHPFSEPLLSLPWEEFIFDFQERTRFVWNIVGSATWQSLCASRAMLASIEFSIQRASAKASQLQWPWMDKCGRAEDANMALDVTSTSK